MNSSYGYPQPKPPDPGKDKPCTDCDLGGFDSVNCEVKGIAAEAAYMQTYQDKLKGRRAQFDTTRPAYDTARGGAAADLQQITQQLKRLRDQLECQLGEEQRKCLTDAWHQVRQQLEDCGFEQGCCVTDEHCTFEWTLPDDAKAPAIRALIEDFERRVGAAEACFDNVLVKEPDELTKRVADLKAYVTGIVTAVADPKTTDYANAFAQLLWAEYRREKIWLGFDTANEYIDCLCLTLNCSLRGRRALAKLTGILAVLDCKDQSTTDRCSTLRNNVVAEILAACRRICPPQQSTGTTAGSTPSAAG
jgi:hypothetical protein